MIDYLSKPNEDVAPILVTGATGFLGGHLARRLASRGIPVRGTGRNLGAGQILAKHGVDFRPVDLGDRAGMAKVCEGIRYAVHCGAKSSAWGRYSDFHASNVIGTRNVVAACLAQRIERLVYISSPSVLSRPAPQYDLRDDDPLPATFVSMYSETKKLAEDVVRAAGRDGLDYVILRPKAIYGPGDNSLFPRIVNAARRGRLPILGDGETVTNLTHVEDVARAIELALVSINASGGTYAITGGEDVRIWDVIRTVVTRLGYEAPSRKVSLSKAMRAARAMEFVWRLFRLPGEPALTTYKVGTLAFSQTYDISGARKDLGYAPSITMEEGIEDTLRSLTDEAEHAKNAEPRTNSEPQGVPLTILKAGSCFTRGRMFLPGGGWERIEIPALFAIIHHPVHGPVVFDTGYSPRFFEGTATFPFRVLRWVTPTIVTWDESAVAQVKTCGVDPDSVKWLILSHFDPDHYGGLKDFPNARVACSAAAWSSVAGKTGLAAMKVRLLPRHLPDDMSARVYVLPEATAPGPYGFQASVDFFDDGSVVLVELPGHSAGQMGAFVKRDDGTTVFLAADGCWNVATLEDESFGGGLHRMIAVDKSGQDATYGALRRLRREHPEIEIVPTHSQRAWRRHVAGAKGG